MSAIKRYWIGSPPAYCNGCGAKLNDEFIDGATLAGPWALLCLGCWSGGVGLGGALGEGRGQKYRLQTDGKWLKVEG